MAVCPCADQSHRYDSAYGGAYVTGPWRGVLHTTETTSLPSYQGGAVAPHFTIDPARLKSYQHYDTARPSRALQHPAGTIDTNNLHAIQFEIIAYSDEAIARSVGGLAVSQLTAAHYDFIAQHMRWVELAHGVRRTSGLTWKSYPASAGISNGVRLSSSDWGRFGGWCGHQHVPNNDHGDPSDIDIDQLLNGADDVTPTDIEAIAQRVKELILVETGTEGFGGSRPEGLITGLSRLYRTAVAALVEGRANAKAAIVRDQALAERIDAVTAALPAEVKAAITDATVDVTVNVNGKADVA